MRTLTTAIFLYAFSTAALASDDSRDHFNAFFEKAMGSWSLSLEDFDAEGNLTYQAEQRRDFGWGIADRFVEERAYITRSSGEVVYLGLILYSLDEETGQTLMTSFWPRSPRRWADFEGQVTGGEYPEITGVLKSYRADGIEGQTRVKFEVSADGNLVFWNFAHTEEGEEYLAERLTYTRSAEVN